MSLKVSCSLDPLDDDDFSFSGLDPLESVRGEEMSLWVDAYRPRQLSQLSFHPEQAVQLRQLVAAGDFPHLLFYGPSGGGKKTRVSCLLRELYGAGAEHLRLDTRTFDAPSGKKLELQTVSSNFHVELCPGYVQSMAVPPLFDRSVSRSLCLYVNE